MLEMVILISLNLALKPILTVIINHISSVPIYQVGLTNPVKGKSLKRRQAIKFKLSFKIISIANNI